MSTDKRWVVFVGPCLPLAEAQRRFGDGVFVPPIRRGDLPRLMADGFRRFAIIDGEFSQSLSVSLVELREATQAGAWVFGASSMGALRAAEAAPLGVRGVGWIYRGYAEGRIESDEEVALAFDPARQCAVSIPLVNLRWAGARAIDDGALDEGQVAHALEVAREQPYWDRTAQSLRRAPRAAACAPLQALLRRIDADPRGHDRKALDALELLDLLRESDLAPPHASGPPPLQFAPASPPPLDAFVGGPAQRKQPGQHRVLPTEVALARAHAEAHRVGVTRLADLTGLEPWGSYSYSSTRPYADEGDITVTGGKAFTRDGARIGALLEAVERAGLSPRGRELLHGTVAELSAEHTVLHPHAMVPDLSCSWDASMPLRWWPTRDLRSGETLLAPAAAVFFPPPPGPRLFPCSSAGAAVGATRAEATLYALLEAMERDLAAYARWFHDGRPLALQHVDDPVCRRQLAALRDGGLTVHCWVVFNEFPLPLFYVVIDDPTTDDPMYLSGGQACHLCPTEALRAALGEAVYSRLTHVSGAREDLARDRAELDGVDVETMRQHVLHWRAAEPIRLAELPDLSTGTIQGDIAVLLDGFAAGGLDRVLAADLSLRDGQFHVVRAVVPGAESAITMTRVGPRLLRWLRDKRDRFTPLPQPTASITPPKQQHEPIKAT